MPELPEVESARCLLEENCVGTTIVEVNATESGGHARDGLFDDIVFDDKESSATAVQKALAAKQVVAVRRKGKQLWLQLDRPPHLLAHFGMTGAFVVKGIEAASYKEFKVHAEEWPPRFTKLELVFSDGARLAFCDPRRLGRLRLRSDPVNQDPWHALAPDPLLEPVSVATAEAVLAKTAKPIKALLLDQSAFVSGVGNWVADEVLFQAGIHPEAGCNTLSPAQIQRLHGALMMVVNVAVGARAEASQFPDDWLFHYRWGKGKNGTKVPGARGGPITFITVGGRTSAVVVSRQRKGEREKGTSSKPAAAAASEAPARTKDKKKGQASSQLTSEPESTTLAEPKKQPRAAPVPSESKGRKRARSAEAHNMEEEAAVSRAPRQSRRTRPLA